ncbi:hypothetical protein HRbin20_01261 [bacterium HR20]|nr:hypothetical protein HRbin20_01261 [bacterium HR20]
MGTRQLIALVIVSSVTFLCLVLGGGYIYVTKPELLGLARPPAHDSVAAPPTVWELQLGQLEKENAHFRAETNRLKDSLQRITTELATLRQQRSELQSQLDAARTALASQQHTVQRDSLRLKNLHILAEMYDRADPAEVAKILANAESSYAAAVLRAMKRKTAARVLEQLPKEKALAISLAALEQP